MNKSKLNKKYMALFSIIALVIVIAVVYYYFYISNVDSNLTNYIGKTVSSSTLTEMSSIARNQTLANSVGVSVTSLPSLTGLNKTLAINGTPVVIYYGAEFCPYCAVSRWGLILALMRFGNFSNLHYMASSSTDVYKDTPTFTFYNSSYNSSYLDFEPAEVYNRTGYPLQTPNQLQNTTFDAFDYNNTAFPASDRGGIPFIDFGNYSYEVGALVMPTAIDNHNWSYIISQLKNPDTTISKNEIGLANVYTAQICEITNFSEPVCKSSYINKILKLEKEEG